MLQDRIVRRVGLGFIKLTLTGLQGIYMSERENYTREPLYIVNRSGNRPSHEHSAFYFDLAVERCRKAGFRSILLRGDTDFSLTENFDRWDDDGVEFIFGIDAMKNLVEITENLDESAWKSMKRKRKGCGSDATPRAKRPKHKERIVVANKYLNKRLVGESIAEFNYQPTKCDRAHRVVVVKKEIKVTRGQLRLFDQEEPKYFFYITNIPRRKKAARQIVRGANQRCDQENNISQLKQCALAAPVDNLTSNWAYMAIASLAWNLKVWSGLMIRPSGNPEQRAREETIKQQIVRMDFTTFRNRILMVPAQIIRRSRSLIFRLLSYRPSVDTLLLIDANVRRPLRC